MEASHPRSADGASIFISQMVHILKDLLCCCMGGSHLHHFESKIELHQKQKQLEYDKK